MRVKNDISIRIIYAVLCFVCLAGTVHAEDTLKPRVGMAPFVHTTRDEQLDAVCRIVNEIMSVSARMSDRYVLFQNDSLNSQSDAAAVRSVMEKDSLDYFVYGDVMKTRDAVQLQLTILDRNRNRVVTQLEKADSFTDIASAADVLVNIMEKSIVGMHMGFGTILIRNTGEAADFRVYLNGREFDVKSGGSRKGEFEVRNVVNGRYKLEIRQKRILGEYTALSRELEIKENQTFSVEFALPAILPEETKALDTLFAKVKLIKDDASQNAGAEAAFSELSSLLSDVSCSSLLAEKKKEADYLEAEWKIRNVDVTIGAMEDPDPKIFTDILVYYKKYPEFTPQINKIVGKLVELIRLFALKDFSEKNWTRGMDRLYQIRSIHESAGVPMPSALKNEVEYIESSYGIYLKDKAAKNSLLPYVVTGSIGAVITGASTAMLLSNTSGNLYKSIHSQNAGVGKAVTGALLYLPYEGAKLVETAGLVLGPILTAMGLQATVKELGRSDWEFEGRLRQFYGNDLLSARSVVEARKNVKGKALLVISEPEGLKVSVNGINYGRTPAYVRDLAGNHADIIVSDTWYPASTVNVGLNDGNNAVFIKSESENRRFGSDTTAGMSYMNSHINWDPVASTESYRITFIAEDAQKKKTYVLYDNLKLPEFIYNDELSPDYRYYALLSVRSDPDAGYRLVTGKPVPLEVTTFREKMIFEEKQFLIPVGTGLSSMFSTAGKFHPILEAGFMYDILNINLYTGLTARFDINFETQEFLYSGITPLLLFGDVRKEIFHIAQLSFFREEEGFLLHLGYGEGLAGFYIMPVAELSFGSTFGVRQFGVVSGFVF